MGMTIAEKILANKGGRDVVRPGDIVTVEVDTVILFDNNFMPANWRDIIKIRDPQRIVVVLDHRVPAPNAMAAGAHVTARAFAQKFGLHRSQSLTRACAMFGKTQVYQRVAAIYCPISRGSHGAAQSQHSRSAPARGQP
jgi:homoaconitase/3-isopropylmalate dehydratase large subunit